MINIEIKYPVLLFKNKNKNLYRFDRDLGLISKGGDNFYQGKIIMIDKVGQTFQLINSSNGGRAKLIDSLRFFQPMQQMDLEFEEGKILTLDEVKSKVKEHIKTNPKKWLNLGTKEMIEGWIDEKKSLVELYRMF